MKIMNLFMWRILLVAFLFVTILSLPNQSPIIGIITQQNHLDSSQLNEQNLHSYIATSYVRFIQMSGAQVVPIFAYSEQSSIEKLLPKLNGVVFPGGGMDFDIKDRWTSNANFIFEYAKRQNDNFGNIFPILGICLGHQLLGFLTNNFQDPLSRVQGQIDTVRPIQFLTNNRGYLFQTVSNLLIQKLQKEPGLTHFNHKWAITRKTYDQNWRLKYFWNIIAQSETTQNQRIISVWQARDYPLYGVQFHPQNSIYGWKVNSDKSYESVQISQIISNRFVEKARYSKNSFDDPAQFENKNIQNYNTFPTKLTCTRIYSFNETKPNQSFIQKKSKKILTLDA